MWTRFPFFPLARYIGSYVSSIYIYLKCSDCNRFWKKRMKFCCVGADKPDSSQGFNSSFHWVYSKLLFSGLGLRQPASTATTPCWLIFSIGVCFVISLYMSWISVSHKMNMLAGIGVLRPFASVSVLPLCLLHLYREIPDFRFGFYVFQAFWCSCFLFVPLFCEFSIFSRTL